MFVGPLAAEMTGFDVLLGVVPGAAGVRHHNGEEKAGGDGADQEAAERLRTENSADDYRYDDGDQARQDHFLHGPARTYVNGAGIIGSCRAFQEALDFPELPPHFLHHGIRRSPYRLHGEGTEDEGHDSADDEADHDVEVHDVEDLDPDDAGVGGH